MPGCCRCTSWHRRSIAPCKNSSTHCCFCNGRKIVSGFGGLIAATIPTSPPKCSARPGWALIAARISLATPKAWWLLLNSLCPLYCSRPRGAVLRNRRARRRARGPLERHGQRLPATEPRQQGSTAFLSLAYYDFARPDDLIVHPEPVFERSGPGARARRAADQAHSRRCLKNI